MTRQHIVFLTGAGVSVDSGLSTFRGKDGLWTNEECPLHDCGVGKGARGDSYHAECG